MNSTDNIASNSLNEELSADSEENKTSTYEESHNHGSVEEESKISFNPNVAVLRWLIEHYPISDIKIEEFFHKEAPSKSDL
jgi:hypothetical protein